MTCDEVRERLAEHALGTLDEDEALRVRRHLLGCTHCRRELGSIDEGLTMFAAAVHDQTPPEDLRDRVLGVLAEEWRHDPVVIPPARPGRAAWIVAAAACVALVAAVAWGLAARSDARAALGGASSYQRLLDTLGGEEFRVGALDQAGDVRIDGSVVLYDSWVEQSWGVVLVRAPELTGSVGVTLAAPDGRTIELREVELSGGAGATWLATSEDLHDFDRLTVTGADGTTLGTAAISSA